MILKNKPINKEITFKEIKKDYNILYGYSIKHKIKDLNLLNDYELFIFIIVNTLNFDRSLKASVENALSHLKNRENAIKCFNGNYRVEINTDYLTKCYEPF